MPLNIEFKLKPNICLDQFEELRVYAYLKLANFDLVSPIVHNDRSKVEGKTCFLWLKNSNGEFVLIFKLFIEIIFHKVGLFL